MMRPTLEERAGQQAAIQPTTEIAVPLGKSG